MVTVVYSFLPCRYIDDLLLLPLSILVQPKVMLAFKCILILPLAHSPDLSLSPSKLQPFIMLSLSKILLTGICALRILADKVQTSRSLPELHLRIDLQLDNHSYNSCDAVEVE